MMVVGQKNGGSKMADLMPIPSINNLIQPKRKREEGNTGHIILTGERENRKLKDTAVIIFLDEGSANMFLKEPDSREVGFTGSIFSSTTAQLCP